MTDTVFDIVERHWQRPAVPILSIIRDAGIQYVEAPLPDDVSGYIERKDGKYRIVTNSNHHPVRRRFTAAHELGHYVYHRDLMGDGVGDNRVYRSAPGTVFYNPRITPKHETQANQFAATVLMPKHLVASMQNRGMSATAMAHALEVSEDALRIRLGLPREQAFPPLDF